MRLVIQRVSSASVTIDGQEKREIGQGLMVLIGVEECDHEADAEWLAQKTALMRIFSDAEGKMNRSIIDVYPPEQLHVFIYRSSSAAIDLAA